MKRITIFTICLLVAFISVKAQSLNPLNYSGKMYITSIEVLTTPRYVSYEEHAILTTEMNIPILQETSIYYDFEKNTKTQEGIDYKIKVTSIKKYTDKNGGWVVVIYIDNPNTGDKEELVWSEFGTPYIQQITKVDRGVNICRCYLSTVNPNRFPF